MTRYPAAAALALALLGTSAASATSLKSPNSLGSCGVGGTTYNGTVAAYVQARAVSCSTARKVARRAHFGATGFTSRTRVDGITWRCTTLQAATGSEPGHINQTTVKCLRGGRPSAQIRFYVKS